MNTTASRPERWYRRLIAAAVCGLALTLLPGAAPADGPGPAAGVADLIERLDAPDYETREAATQALMEDERFDQQRLVAALRGARSPERRHRLVRIAMHRYYARLNPTDVTPEGGEGALGIGVDDRYVIGPESHPMLEHPAMLIVSTQPGFPAFAHLRPGDLILGIDGRPFQPDLDRESFVNAIKARGAGQTVHLDVLRGGRRLGVEVQLGNLDRLRLIDQQVNRRGAGPMAYPPWRQRLDELAGEAARPPLLSVSSADPYRASSQ